MELAEVGVLRPGACAVLLLEAEVECSVSEGEDWRGWAAVRRGGGG